MATGVGGDNSWIMEKTIITAEHDKKPGACFRPPTSQFTGDKVTASCSISVTEYLWQRK